MTVFYVKATVNDKETGVVVEAFDFIYRTTMTYKDARDLDDEEQVLLLQAVDKQRKYEPDGDDVYRVDAMILQEEATDSEEEPAHYTCIVFRNVAK